MIHDLEIAHKRCESHNGLLMEMIVVSMVVLGLIDWASHVGDHRVWPVTTWVLTLGAVLPTVTRGRRARELGVQPGRITRDFVLLSAGVVSVFVLGIVARAVRTDLLGGAAVVTVRRDYWLQWMFFQAVCVALPEELFFRGYLLSNGIRWLGSVVEGRRSIVEGGGIVLSAGVFALSHVLILGDPASILTFFPGLIFSWFFVRMKTLAAPVLLHIAANMGYVMAAREIV